MRIMEDIFNCILSGVNLSNDRIIDNAHSYVKLMVLFAREVISTFLLQSDGNQVLLNKTRDILALAFFCFWRVGLLLDLFCIHMYIYNIRKMFCLKLFSEIVHLFNNVIIYVVFMYLHNRGVICGCFVVINDVRNSCLWP